MQLTKTLKIARNLSLYSLLLAVGFLPLFFIPFSSISSGVAKGYFFVIAVILSVIGFVAESIITGKIYIPKNIISKSLLFVLLAFFVSSLFSSNIHSSLWGLNFEIGTFGNMLALSVVYYLSCFHFENQKNIDRLVKYFTISFIASISVILLSSFLGRTEWFANIFRSISGQTLVGNWNDLVIVSSIVSVLSVIRLEISELSTKKKILNWIIILLSLIVMALVNFKTAWLVLGIFGLISFVYIIAFYRAESKNPELSEGQNEKEAKIKFPLASFVLVLFSLLFYVGNPVFGNMLSRKLNFSAVDIRPSFVLNGQVFINTITESPKKALLGYSPNNFDDAWQKNIPYRVLQSSFWNTRFSLGASHIFTWFVTLGILGTIAVIYLLLTYCAVAIRVFLRTARTGTPDPDLVMPFMISFLSWLYVGIYVPSLPVVALAFASTGLLIGVLTSKGVIKKHEFDYLVDPRGSFFSILSLVVVLILSIIMIYFSSVKFASFYNYSKAVSSNDNSARYLTNAIRLNPKNDLFQRTLSIYYVGRATRLINENRENLSSVSGQVSEFIRLAESSATLATRTNPNNPTNWKNLGSFYELVQNLGQEGQDAYASGLDSYNKALVYSPKDVSIYLAKSRLEYRNKNQVAANEYIAQALSVKPNYSEAYVLRATYKNSANDSIGAIEDYKKAISFSPRNASLYLTLASVYASKGDYQNAVLYYRAAFVLGGRSSIDVAYSLADANLRVNNKEEARILIQKLKEVLPENQDVLKLEQRLNSGQSQPAETEEQ